MLFVALSSPFLVSCKRNTNPPSPECIWATTGADLAVASAFREAAAQAVARRPKSRRGVGHEEAQRNECNSASALLTLLILHPGSWSRVANGPDGRPLDAVSALAGPPRSWSTPESEDASTWNRSDTIRALCGGIALVLTSGFGGAPAGELDVRACGVLPTSAENADQFRKFAATRCQTIIEHVRPRCRCKAANCNPARIYVTVNFE